MNITENLSNILSNLLQKNITNKNINVKKVTIGIQILIISFSKAVLTLFIGYVLDLFLEMFICMTIVAFLRITLGGKHAKTSSLCTLFSITTFLICIYSSKIIPINNSTIILISPVLLYLIYRFAPADTKLNPIRSEILRRKLKVKSITKSVLIILLSIIITNLTFKSLVIFSLIGVIVYILPINLRSVKL
ncbi:MAG: accessory gene regulator B family protein [Clostridium sp.]